MHSVPFGNASHVNLLPWLDQSLEDSVHESSPGFWLKEIWMHAGEGWYNASCQACTAQQGLQLQEVKLLEKVLRVLPSGHLLLRKLQMRRVPELQCKRFFALQIS